MGATSLTRGEFMVHTSITSSFQILHRPQYNHLHSLGSYGYCDHGETGTVSFESDIYSFGVVLLELISGRRAIDDTRLGDDQNVVFWASSVFKDMNKFKDIVDPLLEGKYHEGDLPKVVGIAARCVQKKVHRRPNISQIRSSSTL
ncbi:tyrosine kinase family protein [Medicago truncatula]|uniref:Tyrosine kinase family protein n=1 Tax=Medicago truncatula TaxID=3880 RepID=G7JSM3_MEDTR|nr:tyrosine kinase family protein [Medicago truncatula]